MSTSAMSSLFTCATCNLKTDGTVYVLTMTDHENRFNPASLSAIDECLDIVDQSEGEAALIIRGEGKFFSNGLDLKWVDRQSDRQKVNAHQAHLNRVLAKMLTLSVPTIGMLNGHCYAAGLLFAMMFDKRIMRSKRGWICLPGINLGLAYTPGMSQVFKSKLPGPTNIDVQYFAKKYTAEEALKAGIIDGVVEMEDLEATVMKLARELAPKAKFRKTLKLIKMRNFGEEYRLLHEGRDPMDMGGYYKSKI